MPDRYQETHIRHVPMFSQLPEAQFKLIASSFEVRRYNAGDYILIQGTDVPGLIIVADGQLLRILASADGTLSQQGAVFEGQFIYQNALFEALKSGTHLQAVRPTTLLILTRPAMGTLLSHHPELKPAFGLQDSNAHHLHDVHFKTQRENEEVLLKTRRHWFAMMRWMWVPIVLVLFGLMLSAGIPSIAGFTVPIVFIVGIILAIYIVLEWANDSVIVTDQRVIRIIHTILTFHEVRNEVALESIQEANAIIPTFDVFARIFRYGDVELKTAGSEGNFILDFMPNPEKLQELIIEDARHYRIASQARERETMLAEVERWVGEPFRTEQNSNTEHAVSEDKIKNVYTAGQGPLSPFVMSFPTKSGGIVYRKHWFVWLKAVAFPAIWMFGSLIAMFIFLFTSWSSLGAIGIGITFVSALIGVLWVYYVDWDWRHDYYLLTDNNITIINQRPLWLQNESDQILLKQVDNVVAETKGFFQQMFKFGDVRIALVGADTFKLFDNIANPRDVQSDITRRQQRMKQRQMEEDEKRQRETIGEYISLYHQAQGTQSAPTQSPIPNQSLPYAPVNQAPVQNQGLPYAPVNQVPPAPSNPSPSPYGNRPSISQGRAYTPSSQVPNPVPQQGYSNPQSPLPPTPQQGYSNPQNPLPPTPQQGYSNPQSPLPPTPQQGYSNPQNPLPPTPQQGYSNPQNPLPPTPQQGYSNPQNPLPPTPQQGYSNPQNPLPSVPPQRDVPNQNPRPPQAPNNKRPPKFPSNRDL
ncbi:MAG: hypothetical protein Phog2KO_29870 [Phototrophicaceae bacterium]